MIKVYKEIFVLSTLSTDYIFKINETGHPQHLHYGDNLNITNESLALSSAEALSRKSAFIPGNTIAYSEDKPHLALENILLEHSSTGKGDVREPSIQLRTSQGISTCDFLYSRHEIMSGKTDLLDLPSSYGSEEEVSTLKMIYKDLYSQSELEVHYHVFENCDVITRQVNLVNTSDQPLSIDKFMSLHLDLADNNYQLTSFTGAWVREMEKHNHALKAATVQGGSLSGLSSNRSNPFFMISQEDTTEDTGPSYAFNLIYSGNHYYSASVGSFDTIRIQSGIHPASFSAVLEAGETFTAPEAVMTFSSQGYNHMSQHMHDFIKKHIVRGHWQNKVRPVLVNSWEANYFNFNESKLLKLAKASKTIGAELFVVDDGWFGTRNDDTQALGDWTANLKKLPGGLKRIAKKVNDLGLDFGIWVEPEMLNMKSDLYRKHPDWAINISGHNQSLGRHQMILDLTQTAVVNYVIEAMTSVFNSANIAYVKWDMNRVFTDQYSHLLSPQAQGSFNHLYTLGFYKVLKVLTAAFPKILFESCASGGNRFDLGILSYMPQIWASDNTDAISRLEIQNNYSYGYPLSVIGAHVSDAPNHQTLRVTPLSTRYNVAAFGLLGYELNLCDLPTEEIKAITLQIKNYKKWRHLLQYGRFLRFDRSKNRRYYHWQVISHDSKESIFAIFQTLVEANRMNHDIKLKALLADQLYHFYSLPFKHNIKVFGDLINTSSPIHLKKDSLSHNLVSKFYKLDGEVEDYMLSGQHLMKAGIKLKESFAGVGFDENVRLFNDFASRLYYIEIKK